MLYFFVMINMSLLLLLLLLSPYSPNPSTLSVFISSFLSICDVNYEIKGEKTREDSGEIKE